MNVSRFVTPTWLQSDEKIVWLNMKHDNNSLRVSSLLISVTKCVSQGSIALRKNICKHSLNFLSAPHHHKLSARHPPQSLTNCFCDLRIWLSSSFLKINKNKTHVFFFIKMHLYEELELYLFQFMVVYYLPIHDGWQTTVYPGLDLIFYYLLFKLKLPGSRYSPTTFFSVGVYFNLLQHLSFLSLILLSFCCFFSPFVWTIVTESFL